MPKAQSKSSQSEEVRKIPVAEIHPFKGHPFRVVDDELMQQTVDSIMQFGVLSPAIVRPDPRGGYEMVSGHRRLHACGLAGLEEIPVIVRSLTDDEAVILMVDSNLQRETILPSERAAAYKMKLEALKHQGKRVDLGDKLIRDFLRIPALIAILEPKQLLRHSGLRHFPVDVAVIRHFVAELTLTGGKQLFRQLAVAHPFRRLPVESLRHRPL